MPPGPLDRVTRYPYTSETDYLLINFCQGNPSEKLPADIRIPGTRLYDGPHWQSFSAYGFEGFDPATRERLKRNAYRLQVYRLAP